MIENVMSDTAKKTGMASTALRAIYGSIFDAPAAPDFTEVAYRADADSGLFEQTDRANTHLVGGSGIRMGATSGKEIAPHFNFQRS
jgi:hypothetical protein